MSITGRIVRRALTPAQIFNTGLDDWYSGDTAAGVRVTAESAMRAASGACIRLIADDISSLPVDFFRKVGDDSIPIDAPRWYDYPFANRWGTWPDHIAQVVVSFLTDGNAFVEGLPNTITVEHLDVLDPSKVTLTTVDGMTVYRYGARGIEYSDAQLMHIPWITLPGKRRGLNVIDASKESTGLELAAREWAARFFSNGATLGGIIEVPREAGVLSKESAEALRDQFANRHTGKRKAFAFGVLTGGAKWVQNTVSPQEADLAPLWRHVLEEAARLYHVPPHLLASQESGGASFASVEQRSIAYVQHAIVPIVRRLETAYSRLLPGEDTFVKFNVNALLRGDIKTRAEAYSIALQNKWMKRSEVRRYEDLRPDPMADDYLDTPNNAVPDPQITDLGAMIRAGFDPAAALAYLGMPPVRHDGLDPVTVQPPRSLGSQDAEKRASVEVPSYVASNAERGLRLYEDGRGGDGLVAATIAGARDMVRGSVTEEKVGRMGPWIARHLVDLDAPQNSDPDDPGYPGPGLVAMLLWGAGPDKDGARRTMEWAEAKAASLEEEGA